MILSVVVHDYYITYFLVCKYETVKKIKNISKNGLTITKNGGIIGL